MSSELARAAEALQLEIKKREEAEQALAQERLLLRTLLDHLPDAIYAKDLAGRKTISNPGDARNAGRKSVADVIGKTDFDLYPGEIAERYFHDDQTVMNSGQPVLWREEYLFDEEGRTRWILTSKVPLRSAEGKIVGLVGIGRDITPLKEVEKKLEDLHREMVRASHSAGMAEVATNVLHNVGNVLNSVNVSASLILEHLTNLKIDRMAGIAKLLREHQGDLAAFLANDQRGKLIIPFAEQLAEILEAQRSALQSEAAELRLKINHIKEIVAMQQNYTHAAGVTEKVAVNELVEDAIKIHVGAYARHHIELARSFDASPVINVDRHKVLQILGNILSNAKYACDASGKKEKRVSVSIRNALENRVRIEIADNGIGIPPENLPRLFSQGFTTRSDGHGFGLHGSSLAARELGGTLSVTSGGVDLGATFTLELPANLVSETKPGRNC